MSAFEVEAAVADRVAVHAIGNNDCNVCRAADLEDFTVGIVELAGTEVDVS
jgi:transcription antitermination factor NusA-like protein